MSHKGGKSKGGKSKGPVKGGKTHAKASAPVTAAAPSQVPSDPAPPKFPPFDHMSSSPSPTNELAERFKSSIGKTLKLHLSDGRIIIGELSSIDNWKNLILANTYQAHIPVATKGTPSRHHTKTTNTCIPLFAVLVSLTG
jgi:small nuclear ribonucleoprotein (snRNP)-like protein